MASSVGEPGRGPPAVPRVRQRAKETAGRTPRGSRPAEVRTGVVPSPLLRRLLAVGVLLLRLAVRVGLRLAVALRCLAVRVVLLLSGVAAAGHARVGHVDDD